MTFNLDVPGKHEPKRLTASSKQPLLIIGRNGTGKSALVQLLVASLGDEAIYLPGSRPSYFDDESLSLTPASRRQLGSSLRLWDRQAEVRWRSLAGSSRNEKALHDLTSAETQYKIDAANEIKRDGKEASAIARLQGSESPVDNVNVILAQANLPVRIIVEKAEIKALQNGSTYSVARMSDGERTALVTIAEVVSASPGTVFVIDEPELHLHRAIIVPLIKALVVKRDDCTFVVSTHELDLATALPRAEVAIVRGCDWKNGAVSAWDIDLIPTTNSIPEDVRVDVLGSRLKILFIEGTASSLDHPMYALLFPAVSVRSRESCREVMRAVAGLRGTEDLHRARAFGLIDSDGMDNGQVSTFEAQGIYPLGVFSVESLYYSPELIKALAERQAETAATDPQAYIDDARARGLAALTSGDRPQYLASRVAERKLRDAFLSALPTREELTSGNLAEVSVSVLSTYPAELDRLKEMASAGDLDAAIERYPVRESGVLDAIAKALRFPGRADYEKAALARLSVDSDLLATMRSKLGALAAALL